MTITVYGNTNGTALSATYSQPSGGGIYPGNVTPGDGEGTPGSGNGPGGIGIGDGGFSTPSDSTITTPSITFPNNGDNTGIQTTDTATSSVFAATGGRTHIASRWMILYVGDATVDPLVASPIIIYDSGVDTVNLTTLPLNVTEFQHDSSYQIIVRYKANTTNTWSAWSAYQLFYTGSCIVADLILHWDFSDAANYTLTSGRISAITDLSGNSRNGSQATALLRPEISTAQLSLGAAVFDGNERVTFTPTISLPYATAMLNIFMVVYINTAIPNPNRFGLSTPLGTLVCGIQRDAINSRMAINSGGFVQGATATTGTHILQFNIPTSGAYVDTKLYEDGVELGKNTSGSGLAIASLAGFGAENVNPSTDNHIGELLVYLNMTTEEQEYLLSILQDKWGL